MKLNDTQKSIVRYLFLNKKMARKNLADALGLSSPGLTLAVRPLIEDGIVTFAPKIITGRAGRNEEPLCLNAKYGFFIGLDVQISSYRFLLISLSGYTVYECVFDTIQEAKEKVRYFIHNTRILNVCVTMMHYNTYKPLTEIEEAAIKAFRNFDEAPLRFENNMTALSDIYHLFHRGDNTTLLLKYGPEFASTIMVNGKLMMNKEGICSQIGRTYLSEGDTVENLINFERVLGAPYDEIEGERLIREDPAKFDSVMSRLALVIFNSDKLFVFDRIVLTGLFLSAPKIRETLVEKMKNIDGEFDGSKVILFSDYDEVYRQKAALESFISYFTKNKE